MAENICYLCQADAKIIGHNTISCPNAICKKCGQSGHVSIACDKSAKKPKIDDEIVEILCDSKCLQKLKTCEFCMIYQAKPVQNSSAKICQKSEFLLISESFEIEKLPKNVKNVYVIPKNRKNIQVLETQVPLHTGPVHSSFPISNLELGFCFKSKLEKRGAQFRINDDFTIFSCCRFLIHSEVLSRKRKEIKFNKIVMN